MSLPPVLNSIVGWLRAGYPAGVPESDYIPLIALLSRRLTSDEVSAVAAELGRQVEPVGQGDPANGSSSVNGSAGIDNVDIGTVITKITNELPREEDVARVRARLAMAGPFL
jgi:hypothetical protein